MKKTKFMACAMIVIVILVILFAAGINSWLNLGIAILLLFVGAASVAIMMAYAHVAALDHKGLSQQLEKAKEQTQNDLFDLARYSTNYLYTQGKALEIMRRMSDLHPIPTTGKLHEFICVIGERIVREIKCLAGHPTDTEIDQVDILLRRTDVHTVPGRFTINITSQDVLKDYVIQHAGRDIKKIAEVSFAYYCKRDKSAAEHLLQKMETGVFKKLSIRDFLRQKSVLVKA